MPKAKIAITLNEETVSRLDALVRDSVYESRSRAIEEAVEEKLRRLDRGRLAQQCAKLDPAFERALAEEGLGNEGVQWPEY